MKTSLVDFYYVFSTWNDPGQTAYHVTVRDTPETMDEVASNGTSRTRVLNMKDAESVGFSVSKISNLIHSDMLYQLDESKKKIQDLEKQVEAFVNFEIEELKATKVENEDLKNRLISLTESYSDTSDTDTKTFWKSVKSLFSNWTW